MEHMRVSAASETTVSKAPPYHCHLWEPSWERLIVPCSALQGGAWNGLEENTSFLHRLVLHEGEHVHTCRPWQILPEETP